MHRFRRMLLAVIMLFLAAGFHVQASEYQVPADIIEMSEKIGARYNICPELLQSIAFQESTFRPAAQNGECTGLMQINPRWHQERMDRLGVIDLYDPYENMLVAADYLRELADQYQDVGIVLMIYHGESRTKDATELSSYAAAVLERSAELEELHESMEEYGNE